MKEGVRDEMGLLERWRSLSLVMRMRIQFSVILSWMLIFACVVFYYDQRIKAELLKMSARLSAAGFDAADARLAVSSTMQLVRELLETAARIQRYIRYRDMAWWAIPAGGVLGIWFSFSLPQMEEMMRSIRRTIGKLTAMTARIYGVCDEEVRNSTEQAAAMQQASTASEEMATSAKQISEHAKEVELVADETLKACDEGARLINRTIDGISDVKKQVGAIASAMIELGEHSRKIGKIVEIIEEISDQTNMLALNAAIEAAGAGEAGRRFAVVAVEVRRLAERTVEATDQINQLIAEIRNKTTHTIMMTEQGTKSVEEGFKLIQEVGGHFKSLIGLVSKTNHAVKEIYSSTRQQTIASEQLAETTSAIKTIVDRTLEGAKEIQASLAELKEEIERLRRLGGASAFDEAVVSASETAGT